MTWIGACLVTAFLIGALLGSTFSRQRKDTERDQSHADKLDYPSDTNQKSSMAALARAQVALAKDANSAEKYQSAYNKRTYRVSLWTAIGVCIYTVFTAAIVLFNVVQYGEMHRFNKRQARFFRDQIGIMRGQLDVARDQLVSSNRAFVYFSHFNMVEREPGKFIGISPVWGNSGNTPTVNLTITTGCLQVENQIAEPFDHMSESDRSTINFVLAPKVTDNVLTCTIPVQLIGELNAGRVVLYILGEAKYFDEITKTENRLTQLSRQIASINPNNIADFRTRLGTA